ncbi:MAG: hypothetical protein NC300_09485 [Bacteroidales bacterium]|nr:hypothetical protein [Clostridium sp.]MCM1204363.1 hypothetical protein [Bacteroidales bacterium]
MKKGMTAGVSFVLGIIASGVVMINFMRRMIDKRDKKVCKFKGYYSLLNQWLLLKQEGQSMAQYFADNQYKAIAIYGMGELGNLLYRELKNNGRVDVKYAIDKNADNVYSELKVFDTADDLPPVDVVIVTATFAFDEIEAELRKKVACQIISLEDVICEMM